MTDWRSDPRACDPGGGIPAAANAATLARTLALSLVLHGMALALPAATAPGGGPPATSGPPLLTVLLAPPRRPAAPNPPPQERATSRAERHAEPLAAAPASTAAAPQQVAAPVPAYFPAKALSRLPVALTDFSPTLPDSPEARVGGRLELRLWLDREGRIDRIDRLKTALPEVLDEAALAAFRRMRFRPAEIQGVPVAAWLDTIVEFEAN